MDRKRLPLDTANVTIIGLGLMGSSLALSLKDRCHKLNALEPQEKVCNVALRKNIVSAASDDPAEMLIDADLVILACPVLAIIEWVTRLPEFITHPCVVMDIGSTKKMVVEAYKKLPDYFEVIGGHPICGKEKLSIDHAQQDLFSNAYFVLTELSRTSAHARKVALEVIQAVGAQAIWMDADNHDRIMAFTSHVPYLVASALLLSTPPDARELIGPGLRSSTRLAATPLTMMQDILQTNQDNILEGIRSLKINIDLIEDALRTNDPQQMSAILSRAHSFYHALME